MRIIGERFNDPALEISELASECGISEAYFRRLFDAVHARSPKAYITELRMEYAKKLILSGELSVSDVGAACGFTDPCYFSREFSKVVGVCPSKYTYKT
jgi:AraC-like DNA-binding protein